MVAAWSDRMKFGTSVLALPLRNPVVLAKQIATLDFLSQGRCFPAVGLGGEEIEEYEACGVPKEDRSPRTDEAIVLMRRLWEEDNVTHEGRFFTCHNVSITPKTCFKTLAAGVDRRPKSRRRPPRGPGRRRLAGLRRHHPGNQRRSGHRL